MERKQYIVKKIGKGTMEDPFRPDVSGLEIPYGASINVLKDGKDEMLVEVWFNE